MSLYRKKKTTSYALRLTLLVAGIGFAVKCLLVHPGYVLLGNDVTHMHAWYTALLYYLIDGGLWDLAVIAVCYPAAIYAVWQKGLKGSSRVILAFTLLTAGKFVLNYVMDILTYSGLPRLDEFLSDIPVILIMLVVELIPYALAVAVIVIARKSYIRKSDMAAYQSELAETTETSAPAPVLPFGKLLSLGNPLQLATFVGALAIFLSREISYHVYEITLYVNFGYTDGWVDMLVTLFSDIVISTLIYFAALLLLPHIHSKETENN